MAEQQPPEDAVDFATLMFDVISFHVVATAVRLGIIDELDGGERSAAELAAAAGADEDRLRRLLRAMAALRLLERTGTERYALTASGRRLTRGAEGSAYGLALFYGDPLTARVLGELESAVRGEVSAFRHVTGEDFFDHFASDPRYAHRYHQAMRAGAQLLLPFLLRAYDWGNLRRVVDVGGGDGTTLAAILAAHPGTRGTVFDTAEAVRDTPARLRDAGVGDRCAVEVGDFQDKVPAGGDAYLVKNVLHEWDDAAAVRILRNCRDAMDADGRVLVAAALLPEPGDTGAEQDPAASLYAAISDIQLLCLSGRERSRSEYTRLMDRAGLRVASVQPLPFIGYYHLIEGVAA